MRNTALNLHRLDGHANIAPAQRRTAWRAGVTNTRTEAANTTIRQIKRLSRGYRNPANYRARSLLASATRTAV